MALHQDLDTDGIAYLDLHFTMDDLTLDELCMTPLLGLLLGKLATGKHSALELHRLLEEQLGSFGAAALAHARQGQNGRCTPVLTVGIALLDRRKAEAAELLAEVLQTTRFDEEKAVLDLLRQRRIGLEQAVVGQGNVFAARQIGRAHV